jgi:Mg2+/citrate symporter
MQTNLITILAFSMIMTKRMSVLTALIIMPIIFALLGAIWLRDRADDAQRR